MTAKKKVKKIRRERGKKVKQRNSLGKNYKKKKKRKRKQPGEALI